MSEPPIRNPHDAFFKQTFGRPEFAREFLTEFLPAEVAQCLDFAGLAAAGESFVDDELRQSQSDLVYTVPLVGGGEAVVYLLFEHKSHADRLTVFQMLKYVVRINERRLREGLPLCCVIPLVVYHGPTGWNAALGIDELIDVPESLRRFLPRFSIELFDLSEFDDEDLRGGAFFLASLLLLKYIRRPELPEELFRIFGLLEEILQQPQGLDCVKLLISYVAQGTTHVDTDTLRAAVHRGLPERGEELMPTIAEQWEKAALEKGIEKGQLIGSIRSFQEVLGRDLDSPERLSQLDTEKLQSMLDDLRRHLPPRSPTRN